MLRRIGLDEKMDMELLIWVLQKVGGDQFSKFTLLYPMLEVAETYIWFDSGRYRFQHALAQERDRAESVFDQDTLNFLDRLANTPIFQR